MASTKNTRRTILDLGESLMQDKGFNGFSYAHISTELGIKNAAVHYHFPTKETLGCAVIRRYRDRFLLWTGNARVAGLPPEEKLDWFFSIYTETRADAGKICLVGSMEAAFNAIPAGLRDEVKALHVELLAWLQATLEEGLSAGVFAFQGRPESKAAAILSGLQGGLQMARAFGTQSFSELIEQMKLDLLITRRTHGSP